MRKALGLRGGHAGLCGKCAVCEEQGFARSELGLRAGMDLREGNSVCGGMDFARRERCRCGEK